jgi:molybdopterin-guanine dinucleotide biosynthesis protein A
MRSELAVVVLAGGEGARLGGGKPQRILKGRRLIDRAFAQAQQWSTIVAVAVRDESQVQPVDAELIRDEPNLEGPLGGLVAALSFARHRGCEFLLTIPSDMPLLPRDLVDQLAGGLEGCDCVLASSGGHLHPVCGLWRTSALERTRDYAARGGRSLRGLAKSRGCRTVEWAADPFDPFFNVNSPDDLAEADRLLD